MSEMQTRLNEYYEEDNIAPVERETHSNGDYDYDEMFRSFGCPKKACCRDACEDAYRRSGRDTGFLFSPRMEGVEVSQCYVEREYKGHRIPRIVVVSLSVPQPDLRPDENSEPRWNEHWRGTTTTVRSLLCPFVCLDPAGEPEDESTRTIEQLFVHVRTGKCHSNAYGGREETPKLYRNCGEYLRKEVSILKPDVIVTQGNTVRDMSIKYVFTEGAEEKPVRNVEGTTNSLAPLEARIVHLKESKREVYWLWSYFPARRGRDPYRFYSPTHAGPKIDCENHIPGAKRKNLVLYGEDIEQFMRGSQQGR